MAAKHDGCVPSAKPRSSAKKKMRLSSLDGVSPRRRRGRVAVGGRARKIARKRIRIEPPGTRPASRKRSPTVKTPIEDKRPDAPANASHQGRSSQSQVGAETSHSDADDAGLDCGAPL